MAKVEYYDDYRGQGIEGYRFFCPGCGHHHMYYTKNPNGRPVWAFNGDVNSPTFTPSLLNQWGTHADPNWQPPDNKPGWSGTCHLYVTNGQIEYLRDCTHHLAGKTVPMEDI